MDNGGRHGGVWMALAAILFLSACAYDTGPWENNFGGRNFSGYGAWGVAQNIRTGERYTADRKSMQGCVLLDQVSAKVHPKGFFTHETTDSARAYSMKKAFELGATHVVWHSSDSALGGNVMDALAFKCDH